MPLISTRRSTGQKQVVCTHCGRRTEAARRAMSIFCPHCHKRLILEDFKIRGYYGVNDFATCGDIVVERGGHVVAPIKVGNLTVLGKVRGDAVARGHVTIRKTGSLIGNVHATAMVVESGGVFDGFVKIKPLSRKKK